MAHRRSYDEPGLLTEVLELLSVVFPFFRGQEEAARRLGLRWEACSTPFVYRHDGRVVSHVGVLSIPLVLEGRNVTVGSVHAVATHPDYRRRGYYRSNMTELLEWCEPRYATLQLTTDNPEYFEPFGFRVIGEHRFVASWPSSRSGPKARQLDFGRTEDLTLLHRLLAERDPISHRLGVRERDVFLFNEAKHPLHYSEELDAIVSYDIENETLKLWDVVSPELSPLSSVLRRLRGRFRAVEVHFTPDRLGAELQPVPESRDEDVLMVRGPYPPEGRPMKLPVTSRC